ncbi:hypothetical protein [Ottowia thiooxydans]|uniref:hypothetical protein n=1 Tax=Ottowia thiooxydans TaxID=219182 RepID=UPI0003FCE362|nr:hypothetical protein [Ottowia thiooxydans]
MSLDDTPFPRQAPRFVPTLTEIVGPAVTAGRAAVDPPLEPVAQSRLPEQPVVSLPDAAVIELLARLGPELDARLSETIAQVLHAQMPILNAHIRQAVAEVVRETVAKAATRSD